MDSRPLLDDLGINSEGKRWKQLLAVIKEEARHQAKRELKKKLPKQLRTKGGGKKLLRDVDKLKTDLDRIKADSSKSNADRDFGGFVKLQRGGHD